MTGLSVLIFNLSKYCAARINQTSDYLSNLHNFLYKQAISIISF